MKNSQEKNKTIKEISKKQIKIMIKNSTKKKNSHLIYVLCSYEEVDISLFLRKLSKRQAMSNFSKSNLYLTTILDS